jgi:hypothetical protein
MLKNTSSSLSMIQERGAGEGGTKKEEEEDKNVGQKHSYTLLRGGILFSLIQLM